MAQLKVKKCLLLIMIISQRCQGSDFRVGLYREDLFLPPGVTYNTTVINWCIWWSKLIYSFSDQTATIRRKPTGKYNSIRRIPSGLKAVTTPTVPSSKPPNHDPFVQVFAPNDNINNSSNQMINNCDKSNLQFSFLTQQFKQSVHLPNDDDSTSDLKPIGPWWSKHLKSLKAILIIYKSLKRNTSMTTWFLSTSCLVP